MVVERVSISDHNGDKFRVRLPEEDSLDQDEEYCIVDRDGEKQRIRFHDYGEIYEIPGLYEHIFYNILDCKSPEVVASLLEEALDESQMSFSELRILDLGAGNGMAAEALAQKGARYLIGTDIIEEAVLAARRDRPNLYDDYFVQDFCELNGDTKKELENRHLNCLVTVASLGFGDIPTLAFANAYNLVTDGGWIAFNIKEDFVQELDTTGFSGLIKRMVEEGVFDIKSKRTYPHRLSVEGEPLNYLALVGTKEADIPRGWVG